MTVPYGAEISLVELSKFCLTTTGRSDCFLQVGDITNRQVEAVKAFRQAASVLIQQSFQKLLDDSKQAVQTNAIAFRASFLKRSGLADQFKPTMQVAIDEYVSDSTLRVRYLERDLKKTYLGGTVVVNGPKGPETVAVSPSDKTLLRPNLPQIPRVIDFTQRDKHMSQLRFRAEHQMNIISMLRG
jgi:hypothetical protein